MEMEINHQISNKKLNLRKVKTDNEKTQNFCVDEDDIICLKRKRPRSPLFNEIKDIETVNNAINNDNGDVNNAPIIKYLIQMSKDLTPKRTPGILEGEYDKTDAERREPIALKYANDQKLNDIYDLISNINDYKIFNISIRTINYLMYFSNKVIRENQERIIGYFKKLVNLNINNDNEINEVYNEFLYLSTNIIEFPYMEPELKEEYLNLLLEFILNSYLYKKFNMETKSLFLYQIFLLIKYFIDREQNVRINIDAFNKYNHFILNELINNSSNISQQEIRTYINLLLNTISYSIKGIDKFITKLNEKDIQVIMNGFFIFLKSIYGEKWEKYNNIKDEKRESTLNFSINNRLNKDKSDYFIIKHIFFSIMSLIVSISFCLMNKSLYNFITLKQLHYIKEFMSLPIMDKTTIDILFIFLNNIVEIKEIKEFFCKNDYLIQFICEKGSLLPSFSWEFLASLVENCLKDKYLFNRFYKNENFYKFLCQKLNESDVILKVDNIIDIISSLIKYAEDKKKIIEELNKYQIKEQLEKVYDKIKEENVQEITHNLLSILDNNMDME